MIMCICNICDKSIEKNKLRKINLEITSFSIYEYQVCDNCMSSVVNMIAMLREKR